MAGFQSCADGLSQEPEGRNHATCTVGFQLDIESLPPTLTLARLEHTLAADVASKKCRWGPWKLLDA